MKFNTGLEFKTKQEISQRQTKLLQDTVSYVSKYSPFYKKQNLPLITQLSDIQKLPITSKSHLQKYNKDFYCASSKDIVEIVSTTGTTGEPVYSALTKNDLDRLALNEARSFFCANTTNEDIFHIAVTLDSLFIAGIAYYSGITKLGAAVYRAGMHNVEKHIKLIQELNPTGIITVPSFLLKLIETAKARGLDVNKFSIKKALLIGDSIRQNDFKLNALGQLIAKSCDIELYSTYGNTEGAISFCECEYHNGAHEHPDLIISEILDDNANVLPDGEIGELVLTTLQVTGMPLIRYKTGDITFKISGKCKCNRNSSRIGPIIARKSQMLKFKGVKLYPQTIENALLGIDGVKNYVIIASTGDDFSDKILVKIGCERQDKAFCKIICNSIESYARVTPDIELLSEQEVELIRTDGGTKRKPVSYIDERN